MKRILIAMVVVAALALAPTTYAGGHGGGGCYGGGWGGGYHGGGYYGGGCYHGGWGCGGGWGWGVGLGYSGCGWGVSLGFGGPVATAAAGITDMPRFTLRPFTPLRRMSRRFTPQQSMLGRFTRHRFTRQRFTERRRFPRLQSCDHSPGNPGLRPQSHYHLYRPGLRYVSKPIGTDGCSRHLHPGPDHAGLDAAARPGSGSDLQLDGSAEHDCLLRQRPIEGQGVVQALSFLRRQSGPRMPAGMTWKTRRRGFVVRRS